MEKVKPDLVIVYDKYTESIANGISGRLAGNYTCNVQSDKVFESKKFEYSNNNKILFLSKDLIWQYLSMGEITEYAIDANFVGGPEKCTVYASLYSLGNWRGIKVNLERTINALPKKEIRAYNYYKYFADFIISPFGKCRVSKLFEGSFYESAVEYFLKKENLKLIIPE